MSLQNYENASLRGSNSHRGTPRKSDLRNLREGGKVKSRSPSSSIRQYRFALWRIPVLLQPSLWYEMFRGMRNIPHETYVLCKCERLELGIACGIFAVKHNRRDARSLSSSRTINYDRLSMRHMHRMCIRWFEAWHFAWNRMRSRRNVTYYRANRVFESLYVHINWPS